MLGVQTQDTVYNRDRPNKRLKGVDSDGERNGVGGEREDCLDRDHHEEDSQGGTEYTARTDTPDDVVGLSVGELGRVDGVGGVGGVGELDTSAGAIDSDGDGDGPAPQTNPMMYSLERRFLSQQLETPWHGGSQGGNEGGVSPIDEVAEDVDDGEDGGEEADGEGDGGEDEDYEPLFRIKSQLTYERGNSQSQFSFEEVMNAKSKKEKGAGRERRSTANTSTIDARRGGEREHKRREGWETPVCLETGIGAQGVVGMRREMSAGDLGNVLCRFIGNDLPASDGGELKSSRLKELQIPESGIDSEEGSDVCLNEGGSSTNARTHGCTGARTHAQTHAQTHALTHCRRSLSQNRLTPAVHSADRVQLNSNSGFFPIFRSKKDCKIVYLIRHGESEFNAACSARGSSWEDPLLFDARLTCKGKSQALTLRNEVDSWDLPNDVVWVTSPLTRAIETLLHVHPHVEVKGDGAEGNNGSSISSICRTPSGQLENVIVLPEVAEKLHTSGDVGRNPSDLMEEFPMLAGSLSGLEDEWWYNKEERPNCPYKQLFQSHETKESVTRRVKLFRKWIIDRPEKVFVAVGHSMFWRDFATSVHNGVKQDTLRNCEWRVLHV